MIILLTTINSRAIPQRLWQTLNQQLKKLEKFPNKHWLIKLEEVNIEMLLRK